MEHLWLVICPEGHSAYVLGETIADVAQTILDHLEAEHKEASADRLEIKYIASRCTDDNDVYTENGGFAAHQ